MKSMPSPDIPQSAFSDDEILEIRKFLYSSYLQASAEFPSAMPRNPKDRVDPEIDRLRKTSKAKLRAKTVSADDVQQVAEAIRSPFGKEFGETQSRLLAATLKTDRGNIGAIDPHSVTFAHLLLRNLLKRVCGKTALLGPKSSTISAASLVALLSSLGLPPLLAPLAIWFAARIRDVGLPVLCKSANEYFEKNEMPTS